jgi:class 3 adenylate cyclase
MTEGRRMMRLMQEVPADHFGALVSEYRRLLTGLFEQMGGQEVEVAADSAIAAFASPKQAALVAVAAQRAVAAHEWPHGFKPQVSIGLHSGEAGVGWVGPAVVHCERLCDATEGGQIFLSQATASLLEDEDLGELSLRDLGERQTRRTRQSVHVYELVHPFAAGTSA